MRGRPIASRLVTPLMLGSSELPAQRRTAERPLRQIDHVMIKADDPREVLAFSPTDRIRIRAVVYARVSGRTSAPRRLARSAADVNLH
jgi:hypothetical protein